MMFNNAEIKGGSNLGPGNHKVHIFNIKTKEYEKDGETKKVANVQFKDSDGISHFEDFYLSEKAMWRLKNLSIAAGIGPVDPWSFDDIMGKPVIIQLAKETYKGEERVKLVKVEPNKEGFDSDVTWSPDSDTEKLPEAQIDSDSF